MCVRGDKPYDNIIEDSDFSLLLSAEPFVTLLLWDHTLLSKSAAATRIILIKYRYRKLDGMAELDSCIEIPLNARYIDTANGFIFNDSNFAMLGNSTRPHIEVISSNLISFF